VVPTVWVSVAFDYMIGGSLSRALSSMIGDN